ncbi:MAG: plastocyanin/azurin family copper-binding protein [Chloroflexi bacterium]|nr:plastocyanin/azurin family copper-binding protein [Chloroflexota bacterium]
MSRRLLALIATVALSLAAFAIGPTVALAGDPCFHQFDNRPAPSSGATSQVVLGDCVFTPTVNRVAVGTTVTWRNGSSQAHEVVGSNMTWGAHDKLLQPGDTIGWTFETAGTYAYSCMIHPGMTGAIVVGDPSEAAAAGDVAAVSDVDAEADAEADAAAAESSGRTATAVGIAAGAGGLGLGLLLAGLLRRRRGPASGS